MKNIEDLLKEVDILLEYATPGPWYVVDNKITTITEDELKYREMRAKIEKDIERDNNIVLTKHTSQGVLDNEIIMCDTSSLSRKDDLNLMTRSRVLLPVLVNEIRNLRAKNAMLNEKIKEIDREYDSVISLLVGSEVYPNIVK